MKSAFWQEKTNQNRFGELTAFVIATFVAKKYDDNRGKAKKHICCVKSVFIFVTIGKEKK
jgi:hypothetical protein